MVAPRWQTIPERDVVRSRQPFKFWWTPTISLERLIISRAVNLVHRWVSQTSDGVVGPCAIWSYDHKTE